MRLVDALHARLTAQPHVTASRALQRCALSAPSTVLEGLLRRARVLARVSHTLRSPSHCVRSPISLLSQERHPFRRPELLGQKHASRTLVVGERRSIEQVQREACSYIYAKKLQQGRSIAEFFLPGLEFRYQGRSQLNPDFEAFWRLSWVSCISDDTRLFY